MPIISTTCTCIDVEKQHFDLHRDRCLWRCGWTHPRSGLCSAERKGHRNVVQSCPCKFVQTW